MRALPHTATPNRAATVRERLRAAALIFIALTSQAAQRPVDLAPPQPTIKVGTRLVQIDVLVRDRSGPVSNLTRDDFTILDQGRPQSISVFSSAAAAAVASATTVSTPLPPGVLSNRQSPAGRPVPGATVILLDLINTQLDNQAYARSQLLKYLAGPRNHDQTAIYALGKSLRVVQDFTDDPEKLLEAVRHFDPKLNELLMVSTENMDAVDRKMVDMSAAFYAQRRGETTEQAIAKIAQHLSGMFGRKSLIWLSDAPGINGIQYLSAANINVYPVQTRTVGSSGVIAWANASRENFGMGNIQAMPAGNELDLRRRNAAIAASRGGVAFADARDIGRAVDQAEEDATHTYTLGFYPGEESLDGKFHNLTVSVIPKIKSLDLRYRPGYFATTANPRAPSPPAAAAVHAAIDSPLNSTAIGLTAKSSPDGPGAYHVELVVDLHDLHFDLQNDRHVAQIEVNYLLDGSSTLKTTTAKVVLTEAQLPAALKDGLLVQDNFDAAGPSPTLRIAVRDPNTGALGSLRLPLSTPQK